MAPGIEFACCLLDITDASLDLVNIDQSTSPPFMDTDQRRFHATCVAIE
jgi:hypothetical protein